MDPYTTPPSPDNNPNPGYTPSEPEGPTAEPASPPQNHLPPVDPVIAESTTPYEPTIPTAQPQVFGPQGFITSDKGQPAANQNQNFYQSPPPPPSSNSQMFQSDNSASLPIISKPPHRKRKFFAIFATVLLLLLIISSGGAYAYYVAINNKPEKILADALSNSMKDVLDRKPSTAIGSLKYEFKGDAPGTVTLDYNAKMDGGNYQTEASMHVKVDKVDVTVKGAVVTIGTDEAYIKFDDIQKSIDGATKADPGYAMFVDGLNPLIQKIDGKWIKIDKQSLVDYGFVQSEDKVDKCSAAVSSLRITKDDQKKIKKIFLDNQFAVASEKLAKESVDGEASYHYKLNLNDTASINFTKGIIELNSFKTVKADCEIKQEDLQKQLEDLQKDTQQTTSETKPVIELWVGGKTRRPTKLKVAMDDQSLTMEFTTNIKINGNGIKIEKPANAINIKDLKADLEAAYGAPIGDVSSTTTEDRDVERQTDIKVLQSRLEAYYAENGSYPTLTQLNDANFRKDNMPNLDSSALQDPQGSTSTLSSKPATNTYSYAVTGCKANQCTSYTLTATLENPLDGSKTYIKQSLNQ